MDGLSTSTQAVPLTWVESLFKRMEACYGNRFLDMWANADLKVVKGVWAEQMGLLSADELRRGVAALMTRDWPPTLPEFIKLCRPGLDPAVAFAEAQAQGRMRTEGRPNVWSHPAIYWAYQRIGAFEFQTQNYQVLRTRWERALEAEISKSTWDPIPEMPLRLAVDKGSSVDAAKQKLNVMKVVTGIDKSKKQNFDHLAWARRAVERCATGDRRVPSYTLAAAREALGLAD